MIEFSHTRRRKHFTPKADWTSSQPPNTTQHQRTLKTAPTIDMQTTTRPEPECCMLPGKPTTQTPHTFSHWERGHTRTQRGGNYAKVSYREGWAEGSLLVDPPFPYCTATPSVTDFSTHPSSFTCAFLFATYRNTYLPTYRNLPQNRIDPLRATKVPSPQNPPNILTHNTTPHAPRYSYISANRSGRSLLYYMTRPSLSSGK
jgi:hypothetical protein